MPTYDYVCDACKHAFEKFHSMMDKPIRKCPKCAKLKVRRLVGTGGGIIFKGTGFYQTDYKSPAPKKEEPPKEASKKDSSASASAPSDSKSPKPESGGKK